MVFLTFLAWVRMFALRIPAMQTANIDTQVVRSQKLKDLLPENVNISSEHFVNLFEMPILFYIWCFCIYLTKQVDLFYLYAAFAYVGLRYIHTFIHLSYNHVIQRFAVYILSCLVLWGIWAKFGLQLLTTI